MTLRAAFFPMTGWVAEYTEPIPPSATLPTMTYSPTWVPSASSAPVAAGTPSPIISSYRMRSEGRNGGQDDPTASPEPDHDCTEKRAPGTDRDTPADVDQQKSRLRQCQIGRQRPPGGVELVAAQRMHGIGQENQERTILEVDDDRRAGEAGVANGVRSREQTHEKGGI